MKRSGAQWTVPTLRTVVALVLLAASEAQGSEPATSRKIDFNYQIRPILSDKCFKCHGPDPRNRKAGLRLDTKEGAFAELEVGWPCHRAGKPRGERARRPDHGRG